MSATLAPPPVAEPEVDPTEQAAYEMLTENTGRHMLDSGGAYGRNWERNQGSELDHWRDAPTATLTTRWGYIEVTFSVFHFITHQLEYVEEYDEAFLDWDRATNPAGDRSWMATLEEFLDEIGPTERYGVNTYNGEDLLEQVLQYTQFTLRHDTEIPHTDVTMWDGTYVLLQVHGGADVRGGYTRPRIFRMDGYTEYLDNVTADICCNDCGARWHTDDAYHWRAEGNAYQDLDDVEFVDEDHPNVRSMVRQTLIEHDEVDLLDAFPPRITEGSLACPDCTTGELFVTPWFEFG